MHVGSAPTVGTLFYVQSVGKLVRHTSHAPRQSPQTPLALWVLIGVFGSSRPHVPSSEIKCLCPSQ